MKYIGLILLFNCQVALSGQCDSFLSGLSSQIDHSFIRSAEEIIKSKKVIFFDGSNRIKPNPSRLLSTTWTLVLDHESIIMGANIPGEGGVIGGSHSHLTLSSYAGIEAISTRMSGSVKFNSDGTLFISGFHNKSFDLMTEKEASQRFKQIVPSLKVISSPSKLSLISIPLEEQKKYSLELEEAMFLFNQDFITLDAEQVERAFKLAIKFERLDVLENLIPLINWEITSTSLDDHWLVDLLKINNSDYLVSFFQRGIPVTLRQGDLNKLLELYLHFKHNESLDKILDHFLNLKFDLYYAKLDLNIISESGDPRMALDFLKSRHWRDWPLRYKIGFLKGLITHPKRVILSQKNLDFFETIFSSLPADFLAEHKKSFMESATKHGNKNVSPDLL